MAKLSVLVCVREQEARLESCLGRLVFADEIVVLLDRCAPAAAATAKVFADTIIEGAYPLEGALRAAGRAACTGDWILEVDVGEWVTVPLAREVRACITAPEDADWFHVPVDDYVGATLIRPGGGGSLGAAPRARLYRARPETWDGGQGHAAVRGAGRGGGRLRSALVHQLDDGLVPQSPRLDRSGRVRGPASVERRETLGEIVARLSREGPRTGR